VRQAAVDEVHSLFASVDDLAAAEAVQDNNIAIDVGIDSVYIAHGSSLEATFRQYRISC
jgi:hypothetical protein